MNRFESIIKPLKWSMALLLAAFVAGCGGSATDPILGGGGAVEQAGARPRVTLTIPMNAASGVARNANITATFSKVMDAATLTTATFTLKQGATAVSGVVGYVGTTASFNPTATLAASAVYTATITTGAKDLAGFALAGNQAPLPAASNYVWTFTTSASSDVAAPTILSTNPSDAASGVPVNSSVNAKFSEVMDESTFNATTFKVQAASGPGPVLAGSYALTYDSVSNVSIATFTPSVNFAASAVYMATIVSGVSGVKDLAGNTYMGGGAPNPWTFTTGASGVTAPGAVALGSAGSFGIMATAAITSTGNSVINGDVSLEPGTSMTGFPPAIVNGAVHINDSVSHQARNDLLAAYNYAKGLAPGTTISGGADLGALYLSGIPPGTYTSGSTMLVSTPLVLDAGGNANAVWVFQIGSSLTTNANVTLANGAQAKNVFWVPTLDATVGVGTIFHGTIVSGRDVTAVTGATINGRILAGATTDGTIALQNSTINVPAP